MATTIGLRDERVLPPEHLVRRRTETARPRLDVAALGRALAAEVGGDVGFDAANRALYAQDASNYRRIPLGVVKPRTTDDLVHTVAVCRRFGAPIALRGGGTALAGQTVNEAVVVDVSRYLNRILDVDLVEKRARVELGVVCDDLVDRIAPHGLTFGPKPATHNRCCFGGMLANNCGGMQAQMNGVAVHNVEALEVLLYDGTRMSLGWTTERELAERIARGGREGEVLGALRALRDRYAEKIRTSFPNLPRRVSGYNLDQLLPGADGRFNLARVIVGSEGTLATMLEATLVLLDMPPVQGALVLAFDDLYRAAEAVPALVPLAPLQLEGMDDVLYHHIQAKGGSHAEHLRLLPEGGGWLMLGVGGQTREEVRAHADAFVRAAGDGVRAHRLCLDETERTMLWDAREGALGSTAFVPGEHDTWPGWEDSAVRPEQLASYLRDLRALYDRYGYTKTALYGHFGMGLVHCRVPFTLRTADGIAQFRRFMSDAADLVVSYRGSLSGEHGDGQARAELLVKMFGPELMLAMRELKAIFDPDDKMNPGKIVSPYPIVDHLRLGPGYRPAQPTTHFRYPDDHGSFARATLRCVGVGLCRREHGTGEHDVMCPSYMVTREEMHATRGRAHLLWEMLRGDGPITDGFADERVKASLDLCLACKGCKGDCPVGVDVATYKAEFLSHYYEQKRRPRHAWAFGLIDLWARLARLAPGLVNLVTQTPGLRAIAKLVADVAQDRTIPTFARSTFRAQFARRATRLRSERKAVLWPDTFNDHFHPDTAMAAVRVLEAAGYEVVVPTEHACCGRPLYDFGMLDRARAYLERVLDVLAPHLEAGHPIVVLEPSCASVFRDELVNLMPERADAKKLQERTMLLSELFAREAKDWKVPHLDGRAIVQGHCHHKSVLHFGAERDVLRGTGLDAEVLESGCCGMAGAFGFVTSTVDVAKACGERALLPRVREAARDTFVLADGFSCRQQIAQSTDRLGLHLAEVLAMGLDGRRVAGEPPEAAIRRRRQRDVRLGMASAAVAIALVSSAVVWALGRRRR